MFTGIIENLGRVEQASKTAESLRVVVETGYANPDLGESIAVNGVCLTVAEILNAEKGKVLFFVSPETLARTNLARLASGVRVNLERALTLQTRLSGHLVQGHIDAQGKLKRVEQVGESYTLDFELPTELARYLVEKGSIAINGISLTINHVLTGGNGFSVMIIPHTWTHTNLSDLKPGDPVNLEIDVLAKYLEQLCRPYLKQ
jgi:riboflavin synthase